MKEGSKMTWADPKMLELDVLPEALGTLCDRKFANGYGSYQSCHTGELTSGTGFGHLCNSGGVTGPTANCASCNTGAECLASYW